MGNLIWNEYARLVTITASVYAVWASLFGLIYRKFFWDFVGGTLRDPGGLQAPPSAAIFVDLIIKAPVIPIISMILGMVILAIELPLPALKKLSIHRTLVPRVVLLLFQVFFNILYYQGTNAAIWSLIAAGCYTRAIIRGEIPAAAKQNRGRGGDA
jgi:vacuolar-type H+-ATPase subunit I/STV1